MNARELGTLVLVAALSAAGTMAVSSAMRPDQTQKGPGSQPAAGGVARWLGLPAETAAALAPIEAAYEADRARLEQALANEREALAALLEDSGCPDTRLREQVARVVAADGALEQRTAEFLISVRSLLRPDEQRKLFHRFAAGVREAGGYRWRHGQPSATDAQRGGPPAGRGPGRGRGHTGTHMAPTTQPRQP